MSLMKVILRTTGITAAILSFVVFADAQSRIPISKTQPVQQKVVTAVSEEPPAPFTPPAPPPVHKRNIFKRLFNNNATRAVVGAPPLQSTATPVGVQVLMSDGTTVSVPLGIWIEFATGGACSPACPTGYQLRGVFPTQYVNQVAVIQANGTWIYPKPGRNVQVWRNGLLQRLGPDYTLNQAAATITPVLYADANGNMVGWNTDDYITVAYLF